MVRLNLGAGIASFLLCIGGRAVYAALPDTPPAAPLPAPAVTLSDEDLRLVYRELLHTHDGLVYTFYAIGSQDQEKMRLTWQRLQEPPNRMRRFDKLFPTVAPRSHSLFALDPITRERVVLLLDGQRSGLFFARSYWTLIELVGVKATPPPTFQQALPDLRALIASGALPSADQLRNDPALRMRSLLNAVSSVNDLNTLPPDADLNMRLSSMTTLLLRSIGEQRLDLAEALLKRGADPNRCEKGFCPLQLAIYRNVRGAVDLLLGAHADPNQRDAAHGMEDGPLAAAAHLGDAEVARKLLDAGAKPDGDGAVETPLMTASAKGNRPVAELLMARGADVFAVTREAPSRTALDFARRSKNSEYEAWLRVAMLKKAADSGAYAWEGWIEQDGRRQALDGKPVSLKHAPFRIITRMKGNPSLFVSASADRRLVEALSGLSGDSLRSNMTIGADDNDGKGAFLVLQAPGPALEWGSQSWWHSDGKGTRFTSVVDTPRGREYIREIRELIYPDRTVPVGEDKTATLYLLIGTRVRMSFAADDVFEPKMLELRFRD